MFRQHDSIHNEIGVNRMGIVVSLLKSTKIIPDVRVVHLIQRTNCTVLAYNLLLL